MPAQSPRFIHLRTHSEHSLLEGAIPVGKLPGLAAERGMPAVALTDTNALFAALEFSVKAVEKGVQPIIGCQIMVQAPEPLGNVAGSMVLLAQNQAGWLNLMALSSCLYLREGGALLHVTLDELCAHAEGLICLTGGATGPLGLLIAQGQRDKADALANRLDGAFPTRLYVELQRHPGENGQLMPAEAASEAGLIDLAYAKSLPLVATNDVYFAKPDMFEAHDALICIAERPMWTNRNPAAA